MKKLFWSKSVKRSRFVYIEQKGFFFNCNVFEQEWKRKQQEQEDLLALHQIARSWDSLRRALLCRTLVRASNFLSRDRVRSILDYADGKYLVSLLKGVGIEPALDASIQGRGAQAIHTVQVVIALFSFLSTKTKTVYFEGLSGGAACRVSGISGSRRLGHCQRQRTTNRKCALGNIVRKREQIFFFFFLLLLRFPPKRYSQFVCRTEYNGMHGEFLERKKKLF
jgi:hypothetical protein